MNEVLKARSLRNLEYHKQKLVRPFNNDKNLSLKEYLYMIIPYLRDIINDHKTPKKLKVHWRDKYLITKLNLENGKFN